ncbi:hypothetical protein WJX72_009139 [[Myrmecia] bisecta]|uniref:High light inducible protein n=1 Tax=[Myrmecia] bisecta TaxID=41462 RepID=A0AAW1PZ21_9CHLO
MAFALCSPYLPAPRSLSGRRGPQPDKTACSGQRAQLQRAVTVQATSDFTPQRPPKGVTLPKQKPSVSPAIFGFVENAERINSRAAMIGFFGLLILELVANKGILEMLGFTVGQGLGFEF